MNSMKVMTVLASIWLVGCTSSPQSVVQNIPQQAPGLCDEQLSKNEGMQISLAKQSFQQGHYYSSLATLEKVPSQTITKQALQASAYRKAGEWEQAGKVYQELLNTCVKGNAQHGLGLMSAYQGDMQAAEHWLQLAAKSEPANPNIRNDYGFLLFSLGKEHQARGELITALELSPHNQTVAKNLWLVLYRNHETRAVTSLSHRFNWSESETQKLALAANQFKPLQFDGPQVDESQFNQSVNSTKDSQ